MKSTFLIYLIGLAITGGAVAKEAAESAPKRYSRLTGEAATPYVKYCGIAFPNVKLRLSHDECVQIASEVPGDALEYEPPMIPSTYGPAIFLDRVAKRVIANYGIGAMGYYEMVFLPTKPPVLVETYFMDTKRQARFATYAALYQNFAKQMKNLFDSLQQPPVKGKANQDTEQVGGCDGEKPHS